MAIIKKYSYNTGTVTFTEIIEPNMITGQMIKNRNYIKDGNNLISTTPIINAIDINWNNAYLNNIGSYIASTGDLLNIIDNMSVSSDIINDIKQLIPSNISDLVNDAGYLTANDIPDIPVNISQLNNDAGYITTSVLNVILRPYVTENDILENESLHGKSAYQIAWDNAVSDMEAWPYKNEKEWLASLKGKDGSPGDPGADGKSAYQMAFEAAERNGDIFPYTNESEWSDALNNALEAGAIIETIQDAIAEKQDKLTAGAGIDITNNIISTTVNEWLYIE